MDSSAEVESAVKLAEKRPAEDGDAGAPATKKARTNGGVGGALGSMRKVAEMVLVLAALGKMRGGKVPTGVEKGIMAAARDKLAQVCELFPPKDVFPRDVFGAIIEDLGLNKAREQRLGVRPPKISIAEKFLLSKRKMEKAEELTSPAANLSQRLHGNSGAASENRASVPAGRSPQFPIPSGNFQPSPLYYVAGTNSASIPYQLPTSEVRPVGASGLTSGHLGKDSASVASTRIDRPQVRLDGRPNGPTHPSHVQAYPSVERSSVKAPAWSTQSQSTKSGLEKVSGQTYYKMEGTTDSKSGIPSQFTPSKPINTHTISGDQLGVYHQHLQGPNTIPAPPSRNTHVEISKMVQRLLQPTVSERPSWTPPSRDYMNRSIMCETCKTYSNIVDNVYVCDACEKGYHLSCLQINTATGLQRGEWHCDKCLQLSNGKPLPPKYGRVLRQANAPKLPSNIAAPRSNLDKKTGFPGEKVNQPKMIPNGSPAIQLGRVGNTVISHNPPASVSKVESSGEIRNNAVVGQRMVDDKSSQFTSLNNSKQTTSTATGHPAGVPVYKSGEAKVLESKLPPNSSVPLKPSLDKKHEEPSGGENLSNNLTEKSLKDDSGTVRSIPPETSSTTSGQRDFESPVSEHVNNVEWIGGILKIEEQKSFYQSCCINGLAYHVNDHVLVRFKNRVIPSKLQAMWEDTSMKTKWVSVNRCYFPSDLPEAVGRTCGLESSEVYESNVACNVMAGMIQGPCEVLPPSRFNEEKERRGNENLRPLFLCKWIYDESKGLFRDVNC